MKTPIFHAPAYPYTDREKLFNGWPPYTFNPLWVAMAQVLYR